MTRHEPTRTIQFDATIGAALAAFRRTVQTKAEPGIRYPVDGGKPVQRVTADLRTVDDFLAWTRLEESGDVLEVLETHDFF